MAGVVEKSEVTSQAGVASETSQQSGVREPRVVRYAYNSFESKGGKWSARCNLCTKRLQDNAGVTTAFTRHLKNVHKEKYAAYQKEIHTPVVGSEQRLMDSFVVSNSQIYGQSHPRQKLITDSLVANLIIKCGVPISIVDNEHFRMFLNDVDPKYDAPCRQTITYSIVPTIRQTLEVKLKAVLAKSSDLALTTDLWTDRRCHAFLAVTVHGFHQGSTFSHLLAFRSFRGSHTGQRIAECLESFLLDYDIGNKVRCIVTDNASNMRKALSVMLSTKSQTSTGNEASVDKDIEESGVDDTSFWEDDSALVDEVNGVFGNTLEHLSCFAHSLQLVVRDGLACISSAKTFISKCSKIANLLHKSSAFRNSFEDVFGAGSSIPASNDTRWNSTFRQLTAVTNLNLSDLSAILLAAKREDLILTVKEMRQLVELVDILGPFAEATDITQGDEMVTISCVVPTVLSLRQKLRSRLTSSSSFKPLLNTLLLGLNERFSDIFELVGMKDDCRKSNRTLKFSSTTLIMSPALDPSFAFHWLKDHTGSTEEKEALKCKITGLLVSELKTVLPEDHSSKDEMPTNPPPTKRHCSSLFGHYRNTKELGQDSTTLNAERQLLDYIQFINSDEFDVRKSGLSDLCALPKYKKLNRLFSRIFCMPATSAPVERVFSQSGLLLRPHRCRMSDRTLENLIYAKCNDLK